jgi:hypothetical protein
MYIPEYDNIYSCAVRRHVEKKEMVPNRTTVLVTLPTGSLVAQPNCVRVTLRPRASHFLSMARFFRFECSVWSVHLSQPCIHPRGNPRQQINNDNQIFSAVVDITEHIICTVHGMSMNLI